jgi:hypothetical protein
MIPTMIGGGQVKRKESGQKKKGACGALLLNGKEKLTFLLKSILKK